MLLNARRILWRGRKGVIVAAAVLRLLCLRLRLQRARAEPGNQSLLKRTTEQHYPAAPIT